MGKWNHLTSDDDDQPQDRDNNPGTVMYLLFNAKGGVPVINEDGHLDVKFIPPVPISKVNGLQAALDQKRLSSFFGINNRHANLGQVSEFRYDDNSTVAPLRVKNLAITDIGHGTGVDFFLGKDGVEKNGGMIRAIAESSYDRDEDCNSTVLFYTALAGVNIERLRISSNGNIGAGVSTPGAKLHVGGTLGIGGGSGATSFKNVGHCIEIETDDIFGGTHDRHTGYRLGCTMNGGWATQALYFQFGETWGEYFGGESPDESSAAFTIAPGVISVRNVLVGGYASDINNFHIDPANNKTSNGSILLGFLQGGGSVHIGNGAGGYGTLVCQTLAQTSDIKLKENIQPIANALDVIKQLNPVSFDWKDNPNQSSKQFGLIAQEVEKVKALAEIVTETKYGENTTKILNFQALLAWSIGSIQELSEQVELLKLKLEESQNQSLQK